VLRCVAGCASGCCGMLWCAVARCNVLQYLPVCCNVFQSFAVCAVSKKKYNSTFAHSLKTLYQDYTLCIYDNVDG